MWTCRECYEKAHGKIEDEWWATMGLSRGRCEVCYEASICTNDIFYKEEIKGRDHDNCTS